MGIFRHDCPYCLTARVAFSIEAQWETLWRDPDTFLDYTHVIAYCGGCGRGVLGIIQKTGNSSHPVQLEGDIDGRGWETVEVHPVAPSIEPPEHVPGPIADTLSGALKSLVGRIWPGAGMLARKTVEMAVAAKLGQAEVANLKAAMSKLKDAGELPSYVGEWGEHIRALGNDAAHRGDFNEEEAREAVEFAKEFAMSLYTRPERIRLARDRYETKKGGA